MGASLMNFMFFWASTICDCISITYFVTTFVGK